MRFTLLLILSLGVAQLSNYFTPLHCEVSYSILIAGIRKQCRFVIDIVEPGSYEVTISND